MDLLKQKQWFDSAEFDRQFFCDEPLGAFPSPQGTVFRLWSPAASAVTLRIFAAGNGGQPLRQIPLTMSDRGLWVWETEENLSGRYYDYLVTAADGVERASGDPWARAAGVNGLRSMVIDLASTDPAGWQEDKAPPLADEQIICETSVKDFSWDPRGGFAEEDRGRYTAFCREGTTLDNDGLHPTGIDYLKSLGVTHIQLMPVYDFGFTDEAGPREQYNWGYDPVNYNVPEGSYSSDPYHGEVRIRELKQAIASLHKNGFRVIMDVVYNHSFDLDTPLWLSAPWYFHRQKADGSPSNGSACGNDVATERSMCSHYIRQSVLYWCEEYHMDGFRFDLMGLMDTKLLNDIQADLDARFGVGEKLLYGEPWSAGATDCRPGTLLGTKENLKKLDRRIGAFCDSTRDLVKGGLSGPEAVGFVNGGHFSAGALAKCVTGWAGQEGDVFQAPSQTITYLSCHDDWTLWDKLVFTLDPDRDFAARKESVLTASRLAAAINFCCQGRVFFLSGEEFGRTKLGEKNSYRSSPEINKIDWHRAWTNQPLADYYRGLIALRKQLPGLKDKSPSAHCRLRLAKDLAPGCAALLLDNRSGESRWDELILIYNVSDQRREANLPEGQWQTLADGQSSFLWKQARVLTGKAEIPAGSCLILGKLSGQNK